MRKLSLCYVEATEVPCTPFYLALLPMSLFLVTHSSCFHCLKPNCIVGEAVYDEGLHCLWLSLLVLL